LIASNCYINKINRDYACYDGCINCIDAVDSGLVAMEVGSVACKVVY